MRKQLIKNAVKYIVTAIVSLAVIAYIIYHLVISFGTSVETMPAQLVTLNETITVDALILRDEQILTSSVAGGVNCLYQDGTMVRKGQSVADVYSGSNTAMIKEKVADIEDRIKILQDSSVAESAAMNDSASLGAAVDDLYYTMLEKINQNGIDFAFRRKNEMLTLMNKRKIVQRFVTDYSVQIADLLNQKSALTSSLTNVSETVYTPRSGYFYSEVDGYENVFNSSLCDTMTAADFRRLTRTEPTDYGDVAVGKIATDYKWYIACLMDAEQAKTFVEDRTYTAIYPYSSDAELPMTLYRSVPDEAGGQTLLIFSTGHVDPNFNFLRRQSVEIVQASYTGYRVPVSAVRIVDGREGVYILNGNVVQFRAINSLAEIDGNLIVEERDPAASEEIPRLGFYDLIITRGKNLSEGKIIG